MDSPPRGPAQRFRIADLTLDIGQRQVLRGQEPVPLTRRTFALLRTLAEEAPNVVTHDALAAKVWGPRRIVTPENLSQHVALLRRALGDDARAPTYVQMHRGHGYGLVPAVVALPDDRATGVGVRFAAIAAGIGCAAVLAIAVWAGRGFITADPPTPALPDARVGAADGALPAAPQVKSIAVLPFVNQSADPEQAYFADGLSQELINELAQIGGLNVIARTSSFAFKGRSVDVREIGDQLGAGHVLEGTVRRSGDRLRISAQIIDTATGFALWSKAYDRQLGDVLAIEKDVARSVAAALDIDGVARAGADEHEYYGLATDSAQAYDLALRAQGLLAAGGREDLLRAETRLREALAIDAQFLGALGLLHKTLGFIRYAVAERSQQAGREQHEIMARILAIDPDNAVSHVMRGVQHWYGNDFLEAERAFERAREEARPGEVLREAERLAGVIERTTGRYSEALARTRLASRNDPLSLDTSLLLQIALHAGGHLEEVEREYRRSLDLQGDRGQVEAFAVMRAVIEDYDRAEIEERIRRLHTRSLALPPEDFDLGTAVDDRDAGLAALRRELARVPASNATPRVFLAWWADHYEEPDLALTAMRQWIGATGVPDPTIWTPLFENTRRTRGFQNLLNDTGILAYWRATGHWGDYCRPLDDRRFECR